MLPAIDLDNDHLLPTNEVADISPDRLLANEFAAGNLPVAQTIPQFRFGVGGVGA
jgi:hypothetical protein